MMKRHVISAVALVVLTASGGAADDKVKDELKKLQGEWPLVAMGIGGRNLPRHDIHHRLVVEDDKLTIYQVAGIDKEKKIKVDSPSFRIKHLDPSASPKTIDLIRLDGNAKGEVVQAIYEVKDDELSLCIGNPYQPRPDGFDTTTADGRMVSKCRRPKKPDEATLKELKKLNGTWVMTALENAGRKMPPQVVERRKGVLVFSDGKLTIAFEGKEGHATYTYTAADLKSDPKRIEVQEISKLHGGIVDWKGIYKLDGDVLSLCMDQESLAYQV